MNNTTGMNSVLLTTTQAAEYLNVSEGTLAVWRCTRTVNVPHVKIGRLVRYRKCDLDAYIEENLVGYRDAGAGI